MEEESSGLNIRCKRCSTKKWKHFWVYPYALWDKRLEKAELLVIYQLQMEILKTS